MKSSLALACNDDIPSVVSTKKITQQLLKKFDAKTPAQVQAFAAYRDDKQLLLHGCVGTGKTFIALYLAMKQVLSRESPYRKVTVVRSAVPVRDLGFMPGTKEEKEGVYELPYHAVFKEIFHSIQGNGLIEKLKDQGLYEFISTSYIRGITLRDTVVIVDECENMTFQELESTITRMGENCRIVFCGDFSQSDLQKSVERDGLLKFMSILDKMYDFTHVEFNEEDIVRSSLVKSYIMTKNRLGL